MNDAIDQSQKIVATIVPSHLRSVTLPKKFPGIFLVFEFSVYRFLESLSNDYYGGPWEFVELSNGGFYMSLRSNSRLFLSIATNGFEGEMSADAASIVVNLFTLCHLAHLHELDSLTEMYHALRDFAYEHPEASQILRAID